MLGEGQKFQEVLNLVEGWVPEKAYGHERKFQDELQDYLDTQLNEQSHGVLDMGQQQDDVVEKEHGSSKADVAVNESIGIELKRNLSNSQTKKLRGQIEDYLDNYPFVIVCACGIDDVDGWRDLKNKYSGMQGLGMNQQEVTFVWKKKDNFGTGSGSTRGGPSDSVLF